MPTPHGLDTEQWDQVLLQQPDAEEFWIYKPAPGRAPAAFQRLFVVDREGRDFARLEWKVCAACRCGLLCKVRVNASHVRRGYASRMVVRALAGGEGCAWATTKQSDDGRGFWPAISAVTGVALPVGEGQCEHMARSLEPGERGLGRVEAAPQLRAEPVAAVAAPAAGPASSGFRAWFRRGR